MMNYILFDDAARISLFPLTLSRPVADIRIGITTIREKWEHYLESRTSTLTAAYLQLKYPLEEGDENVLINGAILPEEGVLSEIGKLEKGEKLFKDEVLIALRLDHSGLNRCVEKIRGNGMAEVGSELAKWDGPNISSRYSLNMITRPWEIFTKNGDAIGQDMAWITEGRKSARLSKSNRVSGDLIFVEEGAVVEHAILNAETGPVYIGKDAEIMEGSMIRGPFALGEHATVKMGAKIYGPTTVGPHSKVGGEITNSVIFGYSNKGHDGFIGNSVLGEWCNLGADTNSSNLKNNYGAVKVWSYADQAQIDTGLQFCGLIMGDHSKAGINTMFNTGTVVGVSCNIYGGDFPPKFIPSFSWGGANGWQLFDRQKAIEVAVRMMERRGIEFSRGDEAIFDAIIDYSTNFRHKLPQ